VTNPNPLDQELLENT